MTAAPLSPLFLAVRQAIQSNLRFAPIGNDFGIGVDSDHAAQSALDACHAEEAQRVLRRFKELRGASFVNSEQKTRCWNDLEAQVTALLAKMDGRSTTPAGLGYCPICGAPGRSREKRPNGDDHCEAGHSYPSSSALPAKPEGRS